MMSSQIESRPIMQARLAAFAHDASTQESTRAYQHICTPETYASDEFNIFLQNIGSATLGLMEARQQALDEFAFYKKDVLELIEDIDYQRATQGNGSIRNRSDWLGSGGFAQVFSLEIASRKVAVRRAALAPTFDYCIATTMRAAGIPRTEQLLAASYDAAVTISAYVEGVPLHKLPKESLAQIEPYQIEDLVKTACSLGENKVTVDANAGNFIYNPSNGFTIIDFRPQNLSRVSPSVTDTNITDIANMFNGPDIAPNTLADHVLAVYEQSSS